MYGISAKPRAKTGLLGEIFHDSSQQKVSFFERYCDSSDSNLISAEGISNLSKDLGIDPGLRMINVACFQVRWS